MSAATATERTRLLPPTSPKQPTFGLTSDFDAGHMYGLGADHGLVGLDAPATTRTELGVLVRSATPIAAGLMMETVLNVINVLVVGRRSATDLAVVGNSAMLAGVTAWPFPLALAAALTTLSAPLFSQPDQRPQIGLHLQRAVLLSLTMALPIVALWWNIAPVLRALKQPEELVVGMQAYMRWMILVIPGLGFVECMKAFLQVQGIMHPPPLILLALLPVHLGTSVALVHHTPLGAPGAAISMAVILYASGLALVVYAAATRARECWGGFERRAFAGWWGMLKLAIPGAIMFGSEWWAFEIVALLAGWLGPKAVAAQAIISTLDQIAAMAPYAISIAIANRIGNLLGLGHGAIRRARRTLRAAFTLELAVTCTIAAAVMLGRRHIVYIFTDDAEVADLAADVAIFLASYQIFDGLQNVGAACLRAFGRQTVGSTIHLGGYYLFGLPFGAWLALGRPAWGLKGLWAGQACALAMTAVLELTVSLRIRWEGEVERVIRRGEEERGREETDTDVEEA
ncbi:ethionine resistance protein [Cryptotrichosporon argae]